MTHTYRPVETKVAAASLAGAAVTAVFQLLQAYVPHFHSPPAGTVALLVTIATGIAGYFAPHTPRPPAVQPPPPKTTTLIPVSSARPQ